MTKNTAPPSPILPFLARKRGDSYLSFTIYELIGAIILIGVLVASMFILFPQTKTQITGVTAVDQIIADIQRVQALAMGSLNLSQQKNVVFEINKNTYSILGEARTLPSGVKVITTDLPGNTITFNSLGKPTFGQNNKTITLTGGTTVTIHAIT